MKRCILHVGTTKTGSSSIQESLYFGLRSPGYRYVSAGQVNSDPLLHLLFSKEPNRLPYLEKLAGGQRQIEAMHGDFSEQLRRIVSGRKGQCPTLILSGENAWILQRDELQSLRDFFESYGYQTDVYIYFRPWRSWLESDFQQGVKAGDRTMEILPSGRSIHLEYTNQLENLEQVFGTQSVTAVPFHSSVLKGGCVVKDFLARAKIPFPEHRIRRLNEGLSLDSLRLLLALRIHHGYPQGLSSIIHHEILFRRLATLAGPALRFRSSLIAPLKGLWESQVPRMVARFGELFQETTEDQQSPTGIGCIDELMEYSRESLEWLSCATGLPRITSTSGEAAVRAVGDQMNYLCWHPSFSSRLRWHRMIASRRLVSWLHGF